MMRLNFTQEDRDALQHWRFHHPHPHVQRKMEALWLKSHELPHRQIAILTGISLHTLRRYFRQFQAGGVEALRQTHFHQPESRMEDHVDEIIEHLAAHPPATINEARAKIADLTGIERSPTQVRAFLKKLGLHRLKVGVLPADPDVQEQRQFLAEKLEPRLEEARAKKRIVLFADAAHFVFGAFLGYLWVWLRLFIHSPKGRHRYNVLGAVNAISREILSLTNDTVIDGETVCIFLRQVAQHYAGKRITIVCDNAKYFKSHMVRACAAELGIELLPLPTYSPNLNIIERFWKFLKKQCLYSKYYETFASFKAGINRELTEANRKHQKELESLLTLNFQSYEEAPILAA